MILLETAAPLMPLPMSFPLGVVFMEIEFFFVLILVKWWKCEWRFYWSAKTRSADFFFFKNRHQKSENKLRFQFCFSYFRSASVLTPSGLKGTSAWCQLSLGVGLIQLINNLWIIPLSPLCSVQSSMFVWKLTQHPYFGCKWNLHISRLISKLICSLMC